MAESLLERAKLTDQEIRNAYLYSPEVKYGSMYGELVLRAVADAATAKAIKEAQKEVEHE